ncbi:MAG TPA: hypothetical protein DHW61_08895 [Lachnoclostridium phytofermentans]|uniref:Chemotaxis protein n=1 Tax=Lachnoclostridium phytofermentans TaxID=66219 RepID=A0A3D2X6A3_9FIRM|nr:hypothetical protein [Lachnoclostridium sp.]HCL02516.1 hypothetical protein [Lachnoclostridium phytofermentans]
MQNESLQEIMEKLYCSQEQVEKTTFDVLNEQDKLCCLVSETSIEVQKLISKMEAITYCVTNHLKDHLTRVQGEQLKELEHVMSMVEEQESIGILVSQNINTLATQASFACELVHIMENEVAVHREDIEVIEDCINVELK